MPSFDVVGARIGAALGMLLSRLDTCEQLLEQAGRLRQTATATLQEELAAKRLPKDKRREIDAEIELLREEFPSLTEAALDQLLSEQEPPISEPPDGTVPHPLSLDEAGAVAKLVFDKSLASTILERFARFGKDESTTIYAHARVARALRESPDEVQGAALLPQIVSAVERFFGALIRTGLTEHPRGLGPLPDVKWEVAERLPDKDDLQRYLIDKKVGAFLRDAPSDWQRVIKRWTKIDLDEIGDHWGDVIEAVQRRHLVIHNDSVVDQGYVEALGSRQVECAQIGRRLSCDGKYMASVILAVRVTAMVLALRWAKHFGAAAPSGVLPDAVDRVYQLEKRGEWSAAHVVAEAALRAADEVQERDDLLLVNVWLCKQELGMGDAAMTADILAWNPDDPELSAARHALLGDYEALAGALSLLRQRPGSPIRWLTLRDMPIFQRAINESPMVRNALSARSRQPSNRARRR